MRNRKSLLTLGVLFILIFTSIAIFAEPQGILQGKVTDIDTKEPISDATVEIQELGIKVVTDAEGNYVIAGIRTSIYDVRVSALNYEPVVQESIPIPANVKTTRDFQLKKVESGTKIVIKDKRITEQKIDIERTKTNASSRTQTSEELGDMPVPSFFSAVETLPGIVRQGGQLHIRGGRGDQVNYMVDGVSITDPVTNTFGGTLNTNAIQSVEVQTGGFSAEYGKAISGIISVVTKEGGMNYEGELRVLMSDFVPTAFDEGRKDYQFSLGGPLWIAKDEMGDPTFPRFTFFISGSKSMADYYYLSEYKYNNSNTYESDFDYRDFNDFAGKLAFYFSRREKLRIGYQHSWANIDIVTSYASGEEEPELYEPTQYQHNNQLSIEWHQTIKNNLFYDLYFNRFINGIKFSVGNKTPDQYTEGLDYPVYEDRTSTVYTAKMDVTNILNEVHMVKAGLAYSLYDLEEYFHQYPASISQLDEYHHYLDDETFYLLDLMDWEEDFIVNLGFRYDRREYAGSQISPRLSVGFAITDRTKFTFDYGQFYQPPAAEWVLKGKMDYWMDSGNRFLHAENAIQYQYGIVHLFSDHLKMTLTAYYKSISDMIQFVQGGTGFSRSDLYTRPENVDHGYSEGVELTLERHFYNNFFYRFNYTYSVSKGTGGDVAINSPLGSEPQAEYFLPYDVRHSLSLNLLYSDQGGGANLLWTYRTGYPYTPSKGDPYSAQGPDYKKVDLSLWKTLQRVEYLGGRWDLYITIYNLFDTPNITSHDAQREAKQYGAPRNALAGLRIRW